MRVRTAIIGMILTMLPFSSGHAAQMVELVQQRGLLQLGELQQSVTLSYDRAAHTASNGSSDSATNEFKEKYHVATDVSLLDPDLLQLFLSGDLWLDQANSSGTANGSNEGILYTYSVGGVAFARDPYPVNFLSSRSTNRVVTAYTSAYTLTIDTNQIGVRLQNRYVPVHFEFVRSSMDTSGLSQDSSSTNNTFTLNANNNFRDVSVTDFSTNISNGSQSGGGQATVDTRNYGVTLTNTTTLDRRRRYSLNSALQTQSSAQGLTTQKQVDLTENLQCQFGQALQGNLTYWYSSSKTKDITNNEQSLTSNSFTGSLTHHLFQSLETRLSGTYRTSNLLGGTETDYGGSAAFTYRKKLPAESELTLGFSQDELITDRNAAVSQLTYTNVKFSLRPGDSVVNLNPPGALDPNSVTVGGKTDPALVLPDITYHAPADYTVDAPSGQIRITPGGAIATILITTPVDLFISYKVNLNTSIKFSTTTTNASAGLALFNNRYRLTGNFTSSDQHLISGQATNASLYNTRTDRIRFDATYPFQTVSLEYSDYESGPTQYSYGEGGWYYNRPFMLSTISAHARDRYTMYGAASALSQAYNQNTAEAGAAYKRSLFSWAQASLALNYVNTNGNNVSSNYVYVRADMQGRINKLTINLYGQTIWRVSGTQNMRDDYIHLELTRTF